MSRYAWIVDRTWLSEEDVAQAEGKDLPKPVYGPRDLSVRHKQELQAGEGKPFQMRDDDNLLYFEGRIIGDHTGFEPLDDYGQPGFGCTSIHYRNAETKAWEAL